jgi:hypothetical protein
MNQCIRLIENFVTLSKKRPVDEVKVASVGFFSILGNINSVIYKKYIFLKLIKSIE